MYRLERSFLLNINSIIKNINNVNNYFYSYLTYLLFTNILIKIKEGILLANCLSTKPLPDYGTTI